MKNHDFVSVEQLGRELEKIPGMAKIIDDEYTALHAAEFIESTRKAAHLTQAKLADKIGVSQARISQMEKGEGTYGPSLSLLERVASACGGVLEISFVKRPLDSDAERNAVSH
jgi:DNA-binding XRE family transcriptional regulator